MATQTYAHVDNDLVAGTTVTVLETPIALPDEAILQIEETLRARYIPIPNTLVGSVGEGWTYNVSAKTFSPPSPNQKISDLLDNVSYITAAKLADVWFFNVADQGQPALPVGTHLDADGSAFLLKMQAWLNRNVSNQTVIFPYWDIDYNQVSLTYAQVNSLVGQAGDTELAISSAGIKISADILSGAIKTFDQVRNNAAWPVPNIVS